MIHRRSHFEHATGGKCVFATLYKVWQRDKCRKEKIGSCTASDGKETSDQQVKSLLAVCQKRGIQAADVDVGIIRIKDARTVEGGSVEDPRKTFSVTRIVCVRQKDLRQFTGMLETLSRGRWCDTTLSVPGRTR